MSSTRTWNKTFVFKNPFTITHIGNGPLNLPAGNYIVHITELTIRLHGFDKKQISRCQLELPKQFLTGNMVGLAVDVSHDELMMRHLQDKMPPPAAPTTP